MSRARSDRSESLSLRLFGARGQARAIERKDHALFEALQPRIVLSADFPGYAIQNEDQRDGYPHVVVGDLNGDGDDDVVFAGSGDNSQVLVAINNGDGTFELSHLDADFTLEGYVGVQLGDFNNDDEVDIAVMGRDNSSNDRLMLFPGNGDGTFDPRVDTAATVIEPRRMLAIDVNGDGNTDIIEGNGYGDVQIHISNGDNTFQAPQTLEVNGGVNNSSSTWVRDLAADDFDGDGDIDIAAVTGRGQFSDNNTTSARLVTLENDGSGSFTVDDTVLLSGEMGWLVAGNIDDDGDVELIAGSVDYDRTAMILENDGDGDFSRHLAFDLPGFSSSYHNAIEAVLTDFDGDGNDDLLLGAQYRSNGVHVLLGNGDSTFTQTDIGYAGGGLRSFAVGDFDGDGDNDVVTAHGANYSWSTDFDTGYGNDGSLAGAVLFGNGDGTLESLWAFEPGATDNSYFAGAALAYGDLDGDGDGDLFAASHHTYGNSGQFIARAQTLLNDGNGAFSSLGVGAFLGEDVRNAELGDLDGDGDLDAIVSSYYGVQGTGGIFLLENNGNGVFTPWDILDYDQITWVRVGDVNNDGDLDLIATGNGTAEFMVYLGNGDGTFDAPDSYALPDNGAALAVGFIDDDAFLDVGVTTQDNMFHAWTNDGDGTFTLADSQAISSSYESETILVDLDDDGHLDAVVLQEGNNDIDVLLGNGDGTFGANTNYSVQDGLDRVHAADIDLDGNIDLVAVGEGYGTVTVLPGNGDGTFGDGEEYAAFRSGADVIVADFDGDLDYDIAVLDRTEYYGQRGLNVLINVGNRPEITDFTSSPEDAVVRGQTLELTADVFDADGDVENVRFYFDENNDGIAQSGELIGEDLDGFDGWSVMFDTTGEDLGNLSFLAIATDSRGVTSETAMLTLSNEFGAAAGDGLAVVGTSGSTYLSTRNGVGNPIFFELDGTEWTVENLADEVGLDAQFVGDVVIFTDPKNGLVYVAAIATGANEGVYLFERDHAGDWSVRNLLDELSGSELITSQLVHWIGEGDGQLVGIAGLNDSGELVAFVQTGVVNAPGGFQFEYRNISDDLDDQGMSTPVFTDNLITYVTSWNAWTIAGIDDNGDIQTIWIVPEQFSLWRIDNLSTIASTPDIVGGLSAILTSWDGINVTALDADGNLIVTWWVPQFGGDWLFNDLTDDANGPQMDAVTLTGYFTSWGGMNYAGITDDGEVTIYWWVPGFANWEVSTITDGMPSSNSRPIDRLTSFTSETGGGTDGLNILGQSEDNEVIRLSWMPGQGATWMHENVTDLAMPG